MAAGAGGDGGDGGDDEDDDGEADEKDDEDDEDRATDRDQRHRASRSLRLLTRRLVGFGLARCVYFYQASRSLVSIVGRPRLTIAPVQWFAGCRRRRRRTSIRSEQIRADPRRSATTAASWFAN